MISFINSAYTTLTTHLINTQTTLMNMVGDDNTWTTLANILKKLIPILWVVGIIASTFWLIIKYMSAKMNGATGDQAKYEASRKAIKRALGFWTTTLIWPVLLVVGWLVGTSIAKAIYPGLEIPSLFNIF